MDEVGKANAARQAAERVARASYGRLVAFLAARSGDIAGAEDALAEAFASALEHWPSAGVPANPDAWLLTVARRRQGDAWRRRQTGRAGEAHLSLIAEEIEAGAADVQEIPDRRLALMFACAHPEIEPGLRAPLILQTLLGFTAADIGSAFLVPPATMGQRLVRAKARIKAAHLPFHLPEPEERPVRLAAVLEAVYAGYAKGWAETGDTEPSALAGEAIWLGQLLVAQLPQEPEAKGMLALMLYSEARRPARRDARGAYVPLDAQDTDLWDRRQIALAGALLSQASAAGPTGRYQLEAAIQSAHIARRVLGEANAADIVALYDHLYRDLPSPVVALNRAVARAQVEGPGAVLAEIARLADDPHMADYQPYWAARGHLYAAVGRTAEAADALRLALGLSADPAVRDYLQGRLDELPRQ